MLRRGLAITILLTIGILSMTLNAQASGWRADECRYRHGGNFSRQEVRTTIRCVARRFGVSRDTALYVANRESGYHWWARNANYPYCAGIFQHVPSLFPARLAAVPNRYRPWSPSVWNARANILAALWTARAGWGPWAT